MYIVKHSTIHLYNAMYLYLYWKLKAYFQLSGNNNMIIRFFTNTANVSILSNCIQLCVRGSGKSSMRENVETWCVFGKVFILYSIVNSIVSLLNENTTTVQRVNAMTRPVPYIQMVHRGECSSTQGGLN